MENLHQLRSAIRFSWPAVCSGICVPIPKKGRGKNGIHSGRERYKMERLFSSEALYRTLALFFRYPEEPLNPRLISGHTGVDIKSVLRELKKLKEVGILHVREAGRYRMYTLNRRHPVIPGLQSIFNRARKDEESRRRDPIARILGDLFTLPLPP